MPGAEAKLNAKGADSFEGAPDGAKSFEVPDAMSRKAGTGSRERLATPKLRVRQHGRAAAPAARRLVALDTAEVILKAGILNSALEMF